MTKIINKSFYSVYSGGEFPGTVFRVLLGCL